MPKEGTLKKYIVGFAVGLVLAVTAVGCAGQPSDETTPPPSGLTNRPAEGAVGHPMVVEGLANRAEEGAEGHLGIESAN